MRGARSESGHYGRCERCGRGIRYGKVCRRCEADVARQLEEARRLVNRGLRGIGYAGTVGGLRSQVLPALRRAGMQGLTLARDSARIGVRIAAIMAEEHPRGGDAA